MLRQDAFTFGDAISELSLMESICDRSADLPMDAEQIVDTRQLVHQALQKTRQICIVANLEDRICPEIMRFQASLETEPLKQVALRCSHLRERILDELKNEFYFHVPHDDIHYYGQAVPFGNIVARKFRAATAEFAQAAKCLSLQQPTACVFHLMRGMETAVQRLARKLSMTITPQTTWRNLTGNMDAKIRDMPATTKEEKQKKNNWEEARVNLHHLGSVIRNNTMHPTSIYTQEEAKHIFESVRVSMKALCHL